MQTNLQKSLLIIDTEIDAGLIAEALAGDYAVHVSIDRESALRSAVDIPPDLILMEAMITGMDGFEVCRFLKNDLTTRDIPIIFLTTLNEDVHETRGLELGAVDYITKPFNPAVVKVRIRNQFELKRNRDRLAATAVEQTNELTEARNHLKSHDVVQHDYLHAISHELRTPINVVLGVAEMALDDLKEEQRNEYMAIYEPSRRRLLMAVDNVLLMANMLGKGTSIPTFPVDLFEIVTKSWCSIRGAFFCSELSIVAPQAKPGLVLGNEELLRQSVTTRLKTALKMATPGTPVTAKYGEGQEQAILRLVFQGSPLTDELQRTFFDAFSYDRSSSCVEDLGLAIPLAAHLVRAMGGSVDLRETSSGVEISLTLLKTVLDQLPQHIMH